MRPHLQLAQQSQRPQRLTATIADRKRSQHADDHNRRIAAATAATTSAATAAAAASYAAQKRGKSKFGGHCQCRVLDACRPLCAREHFGAR